MRRVCAGEFLECVGKVNNLQFSIDNFGDCCHTVSSEPYFYDESYAICKPQKSIPVDECGRCAVAQEIDKRDSESQRPLKWKCTSECKCLTKDERQIIVDLKSLFQENVCKLRQGLNDVDSDCMNGHYA